LDESTGTEKQVNKKYSKKKLEEWKKTGNYDSRYRFYEHLETVVNTRCFESDVKAKAIQLFFDVIKEENISNTEELFNIKRDLDDFWFTLFPKPQLGGHREIAIQDLQTRINTFIFERCAEETNKTLDEEILTNSKKFFLQSEIVSESRKLMATRKSDDFVYRSIYNNEDNSRWGPSLEALLLRVAINFR